MTRIRKCKNQENVTHNQEKKSQQKQISQTSEVAGKDFKIIINMINNFMEKKEEKNQKNSTTK